ncbi:unnamed protein product [Lathyrus sativus]|nr:unnamed protein product [Lathyrus sativus]
MVGTPPLHTSTFPMITLPRNPFHSMLYLPHVPRRKINRITATSADAGNVEPSNNPLSLASIRRQTRRPLTDFGFGGRSIWEGGVGLFLVSGAVLFALSLAWLKGFQIRSNFSKYTATFEFSQASGISTGTPVRIRGVTVGDVIRVNPSLKSIEAVVEIEDDKTIIPRNSLVEVNQSGLLMETIIDITPRDPIPTPSAGPLDKECHKEGLIVCDREKMKGSQGMKAMAEDLQPLLADVRDSGLLKEVENLTRSLTQASDDLRRAHSSIMTPENTELIQKSIYTLIFTLKNIENVSSDILGFTGDEATRKNLKLLIKSLSRLL